MALKMFKVLWVFSLLAVLVVFMYVYASLPVKIVVNESVQFPTVAKEAFFYTMLALLAISNTLVFLVSRIFPDKAQDFKAWIYGLIMLTNLFFIIGLSFVSLYNSGEKYDYPRLGIIIYGSLALMGLWILAWPIYRVGQKILNKQPV